MNEFVIGKNLKDNSKVIIDLDSLVKNRMLIQASAGGGKSYLLRKILEETHGLIPQIVIDSEGEFSTLREKFPYVLIGEDGDLPIDIRSAELLAKKLLETRASAILDLYGLKKHERPIFVKKFLDAIMNVKKELWHPTLIAIDEAHLYCPEGKSGKSEATFSVIDLMSRGRKRGYVGILATQRLSKLNKDASAECDNRFIGKCIQDIDRVRAAAELGIASKEKIIDLRKLKPGEFYAFGSSISEEVIKIKIAKVKTSHPEAGMGEIIAPLPQTSEVKKVLKQLIDLPQKAEEELREKQDYLRKIRELESENKKLKIGIPKQISEKEMKQLKQIGFEQGVKQTTIEFKKTHAKMEGIIKLLESRIKSACTDLMSISNFQMSRLPKTPTPYKEYNIASGIVGQEKPLGRIKIENPLLTKTPDEFSEVKLQTGAIRMLNAVATFQTISKVRLQTLSGISSKGTFGTYLAHLKRKDYIQVEGHTLTITSEGMSFVGEPETFPSDTESLINLWAKHLQTGAIRMLRICVNSYPDSISKTELQEEVGISSNGTFGTYLAHLKRNQLIKVDGLEITASAELFE